MKVNAILALIVWGMFLMTKTSAQTVTWKAEFISPTYFEDTGKRPCPVFQKRFQIRKPARSATLLISALGLYEATLNGRRIGDAYFSPGFNNYKKRLQYQSYDVTGYIKQSNQFKITVGEGWYRGVFRGAKKRDNYGSDAGLFVQLELIYKDGSRDTIATDQTWTSAPGPIRYSELYDGELYDARFAPPAQAPVKILNYPKENLVSSESPPVTKHEQFKPMRIFKDPLGEELADFGQNLAGWVRLRIKGDPGDSVRINHGEVLDKTGNFYTGNLRTARATDTYILKGSGFEIFEPHFTYHGFRYIKIEMYHHGKWGIPMNWKATAVALYTDLEKTGTFSCSDKMINRLEKNIEWSLNSNFFDIPTDCPQRSERLGWTGDAQVFAATASFLRNTKSFYVKWLKDLASEQGANGGIPKSIPWVYPYDPIGGGIAGWGDAATIIPWTVYQSYGDTAVLRNQYYSMKSWVDYIRSRSVNCLWQDNGYGDWYAPGPTTDIGLIDQCFWAYSTTLLIRAATVLGKPEDVSYYNTQLAAVKKAFIQTYLAADGRLSSDTQTAYVLALRFGMLPDSLQDKAVKRLVTLIHNNKDHLATGFLGTPYLLQVLCDHGQSKLAYDLINHQTYPSWLYPVTMGATTIWEKWDGMKPDGSVQATSYNHYAYGAVGNWLYQYVAGIRLLSPGYRRILIKPVIGGGLTWAKASYKCAYGEILSSWKVKNGILKMMVTIPEGTTAAIVVPGKKEIAVGPGHYIYRVQL